MQSVGVNAMGEQQKVYGLAVLVEGHSGHGYRDDCLAVKQKGGWGKPYYFGPLYATEKAAEAAKHYNETVVELTLIL